MTTSRPSCSSGSKISSSTAVPTRPIVSSDRRFGAAGAPPREVADLAWRNAPVHERLAHALVQGIADYVVEDTEEARRQADGRST